LYQPFDTVAQLELSTMTSSPDTHTNIIQDESEQYRGLDATSYTARRLVRIDSTDP
jgi:hypothetical protein